MSSPPGMVLFVLVDRTGTGFLAFGMRRIKNRLLLALAVCLSAATAFADDRVVRLAAPDSLIENGFLKFLLPRFSLKTQVRVEILPAGADADVSFGEQGTALFQDGGTVFALNILSEDHSGTIKFEDWILSDVGLRTITDFMIDGAGVYSLASLTEEVEEVLVFEGDASAGEKLSQLHCGRCHVTSKKKASFGIGSTPSFHVLRAMGDWDIRFQSFFALNPHPAFTQIVDVTEPFPEDRPSPIVPVEITLDEFDAILAYVSDLEPADLGAPLELQ